jgi:putative phosphoesterase
MPRIGLISDTHGLLRPEAVVFLRSSTRIIHGGDIGGASILQELAAIAPVTAVRGNNDRDCWADTLPDHAVLEVGERLLYVVHNLAQLAIDPVALGVHVVVSGHSHKPSVHEHRGVLYVNPGSAGPRRFTLPVSVAELIVVGTSVEARVVELEVAKQA